MNFTLLLVGLALPLGCNWTKRESFDAAIARDRGTLVDQVNQINDGVPFFTEKTLNPTWDDKGKTPVVTIPSTFKMIGQDGRERGSALFNGRISFVAFMFTTCTGFCPNLVSNLKRVAKEVGEVPNSQYILITVDPEHDTAPVLRAYAKKMTLATQSHWSLLTGNRDDIYSLAKKTFASQAFERADAQPRRFAHSEHFYVIDQQGRLRGVLNGNRIDTPQEAAKLVAKLAL